MPNADPAPSSAASPSTSAPAPALLFAALGDRTRLTLVERLSASAAEQSLSRLGADLPMSRQAIRKHLAVLEEAGLVSATARGREQRFKLHPEPIHAARACLDAIAGQWDTLLGRLKAEAER